MGKPTELVDIQKTYSKWGNQPSWLIFKKPIQKTDSKNRFKKPIQKTDSKNRFKKPRVFFRGAKRLGKTSFIFLEGFF